MGELRNSVTEQLLSSCAGALITSMFVTPFDVVKIRLQVQEASPTRKKCYHFYSCLWDNVCYCFQGDKCKRCGWYHSKSYFHGTWDAFAKITKHEGFASLWSGFPPTLVMAVPATVIYFTMYEQIRDISSANLSPSLQPYFIPMMSGACARVLTVTAVSPIEFLRTKVQSERIKYSDLWKSVAELVKRRGLVSLWHGWVPTLLRDVPFSAIYWTVYEQLKAMKGETSIIHSFVSGSVAGAVAAAVTVPFDVIKTHRQAELGEAKLLNKEVQARTISLIVELYKKRGAKSLFAGIVPRVMKVAPSCAIMISTYEFGKMYFREKKAKAKAKGDSF